MTAATLCAAFISLSLPNFDTACRHMEDVVTHSVKNDVKPEVLLALIHEESRWIPTAVSSAKACGLTQVLPKYTKPKVTCQQLKDPQTSIAVGAKTLSFWVSQYGRGNYKIGLCGYNSGYACKRAVNAKQRSVLYANRVLALAKKIKNRARELANW